jgi:Flp pilus assembly pilin Flp
MKMKIAMQYESEGATMSKLSPRAILDRNLAAGYVRALVGLHAARLREARQRRDAGASAIELAIITAILVGLAVAVLVVVTQVVTTRKTEITTNNNGAP